MRIFVFVLIYYGYSIRMIQSQEKNDLKINSNQPSYYLTKQSHPIDVAGDHNLLVFFDADNTQFLPINYQNFPSEIENQETYSKQYESQFIDISKDEIQSPHLNGQPQSSVTSTVNPEHLNNDIVSYKSQEAGTSQNPNYDKKEPLGYKQANVYSQNPYSLVNNHTAQSQRPTVREVNHLERPDQHQEYSQDTDPSIQSSRYHHVSQPQLQNFVISSYNAPVQKEDFIPPSIQLITSHQKPYSLNSDRDNSQALHSPMNSMTGDKSTQEQIQQIFINQFPIPINSLNDQGSYFQNSAYNNPDHSPTSSNSDEPRPEPATQDGGFFINHKQPQLLSIGNYEAYSPFQYNAQTAGLAEYKQTVDVPQITPIIATEPHNPINDQESNLGRPTASNSYTSERQPVPLKLPNHQYSSFNSDVINVAKPFDIGNFKGFQKLTATRTLSQDELALDMKFPEKPCDVCCKGEEVEPCKSCCNFIPLVNVKTFKTILG